MYAGALAVGVVTYIIAIAITIVTLIAGWKINVKMGEPGWAVFVPFFDLFVIFRAMYGNGWKFLFLLIPFYNIYVGIKLIFDQARRFGRSVGFGFGLLFLNTIFSMILAFGSAEFEKRY